MYKLKALCLCPVSESIFYFVCWLHFCDVKKGIGSGMKNTYFKMAFEEYRRFIWLETW